MAYKVLEIANKLLVKASFSDFHELISNIKLHKLLYYMQEFHLAYFGNSLFEEEMEAWLYGPVVPIVYENYKHNENRGIECSEEAIKLSPQEEALFDEVYQVYGKYSATWTNEYDT